MTRIILTRAWPLRMFNRNLATKWLVYGKFLKTLKISMRSRIFGGGVDREALEISDHVRCGVLHLTQSSFSRCQIHLNRLYREYAC